MCVIGLSISPHVAVEHNGLTVDEHTIECPKHGSEFDVMTGAAITLPAVKPVQTFPVRVTGDDVWIEV